jgi:alkylated DNA repair dioxygenase AlkB
VRAKALPGPQLFDAGESERSPHVVLARDGVVTYDSHFLDRGSADAAFRLLLPGTAWAQESLTIYGRRIPFPRLTAWYGDPGAVYTYSGIRNEPHRWTPPLRELRDRLERRLGVRFNSVLLNQYRHGEESMGWHADDEPELGDAPLIASLSLGAVREFQLKHRGAGRRIALALGHGSLLLMSGETQRSWLHRLPKAPLVPGIRLNLTFRLIIAPASR